MMECAIIRSTSHAFKQIHRWTRAGNQIVFDICTIERREAHVQSVFYSNGRSQTKSTLSLVNVSINEIK
jgi:hypothetical protein